jgi:hypothetical protein
VEIGDLDGDGKPDLVTASYKLTRGVYSLEVRLGDGDGTFGASHNYATGRNPSSVAIGDLNGDGRPDLAVGNDGESTVSVLLGNGDGTFGAKTYDAGDAPFSVAIGDLNADGQPDLVVANHNSLGVSALLGNGNGTFAAKQDFRTSGYPSSVAIGDLNGDGKPDLAVTNSEASGGGPHTVSVLLGNGDGTFGVYSDFDTGSAPVFVAIGDLNGDGRLDLVVANEKSSTLSVLLGNGDGTFGAKNDYATAGGPTCVAIGDLNGDGRSDLAVASYTSGPVTVSSVSVLLGNGDGTFGARNDYSTGDFPVSVAIGDLNADGKPDLVVANNGPATVSVLLGNGDGTFGAKSDYPSGSGFPYGPTSVAIGDLDGDGKPDLAVANSDTRVSVLLGNGGGTLGAKSEYGTGDGPSSVAIADLNLDGKPDLAVANVASGTVSVLVNIGGVNNTGVEPTPPGLGRAFLLLAPRPNPSRGTSEIRFVLPSARAVAIDIFDLAGRRVWSWASVVELSAGPHAVTWTGRGGSGGAEGSGVYWLKLRAGRDRGVRKLVLQR